MKTVLLLVLAALPLGATPLAEPTRVTPPGFGEARQPQIAIADDGIIQVAFGRGEEVYTARSDDQGASFSAPSRAGGLPKLALGMRRGPRVAVTGQAVIVTAISHDDGNLYSWRSGDGGRSWSATVRINTAARSAVEGLHGMASSGKGAVAAVWLDLRNGKTELWSSVSNDHGKSWPANTRIYRSPGLAICECCHPSVAFTASGEIVVMWRNSLEGSRDMYTARSSDGGGSFSAAVKVEAGTWKLAACPMDGGSLAVDGESIAYAWRRDRQILTAIAPGAETVWSDSGSQPVAVRTERGFGCLWQDQGSLYWKVSHESPPVLAAREAGYASAAWSRTARRSIVVWEGRDGVYAQSLP